MGLSEGVPDVNPRQDQKAGQIEEKSSIVKQPNQMLPGSMTKDLIWREADYSTKRQDKYIYMCV